MLIEGWFPLSKKIIKHLMDHLVIPKRPTTPQGGGEEEKKMYRTNAPPIFVLSTLAAVTD